MIEIVILILLILISICPLIAKKDNKEIISSNRQLLRAKLITDLIRTGKTLEEATKEAEDILEKNK
jgi:hypothetical protein